MGRVILKQGLIPTFLRITVSFLDNRDLVKLHIWSVQEGVMTI